MDQYDDLKHISAEVRDKIPADDFGDAENRRFPIRDQSDLDHAAHLIGHASPKVKARIIAIAKRKGLALPKAWSGDGGSTKDAGDVLLLFGGAVKALDDSGKVGGYLVLFGSAEKTDASAYRDYFTPETDFGLDLTTKARVLYQHGMDAKIGNRALDIGEMKTDEAGVWIDSQLKMRDDYERAIFAMAKAGKLGWSSGTAKHLIRREPQPNGSHRIVSWPLGLDASLTPNPAEPRTQAVALKSLFSDGLDSHLGGETLADHSARTLETVRGFLGRFDSYADMKQREDRHISPARREELKSLGDQIAAILDRTKPRPSRAEVLEAKRRALKTLAEDLINIHER